MGTHSKEPTWWSSLMELPRRDKIVTLGALVVSLALLVGLYAWGASRTAPEAVADAAAATTASLAPVVAADPSPPSINAARPAPMAQSSADSDVAPAPGMDPRFAPPDGPSPDEGPFSIDRQAMRAEFETHGVTTSDAQLAQVVVATNAKIAQGDPDLDVWDPEIKKAVVAIWPDLDPDHQIDIERCFAEYVERVIARNAGWSSPPDTDDHDEVLEGRGPQPRVSPASR